MIVHAVFPTASRKCRGGDGDDDDGDGDGGGRS